MTVSPNFRPELLTDGDEPLTSAGLKLFSPFTAASERECCLIPLRMRKLRQPGPENQIHSRHSNRETETDTCSL